jgi:cytochrome o ubiquinol oxidase subunit 2
LNPPIALNSLGFNKKFLRVSASLAGCFILAGCQSGILHPEGPVGVREAALLLETFGIMMIVVLPVIFMTVFFAWRYRAGNERAVYAPDWSRSPKLEILIWSVPFVIVVFLGAVCWRSTHALDPYRPLQAPGKSLTIEVVALDWKWLFIYPDAHIAVISQLEIPVNTQIEFRITSATVMNVFFIPQLGTQIYAMPGMQTELHLLAKNPGIYAGISANFSGDGFGGMHFSAVAVNAASFRTWVKRSQAAPATLNGNAYQRLAAPSENNKVQVFGTVDPALFGDILAARSDLAKRAPGAKT